jgi:hypothetical protein
MTDDMIDIAALTSAIHAARPGTTVRVTFEVTVPDEPPPGTGVEPTPEPAAGPAARMLTLDPARATPCDRVRSYIDAHGDRLRKESEWGADARRGGVCLPRDLSAREIERARQAGVIPWTPKVGGRDDGAVMIRASDLLAYLERRAAIQEAREPAPDWWSSVVPRRLHAAAARVA